ncbi:MAG: hypothetical protein ACREYE_12165 [Gammaproteobacteria bacterium]
MSETIAITGKSVKLFKGHYTRISKMCPSSMVFSKLLSRLLGVLDPTILATHAPNKAPKNAIIKTMPMLIFAPINSGNLYISRPTNTPVLEPATTPTCEPCTRSGRS